MDRIDTGAAAAQQFGGGLSLVDTGVHLTPQRCE
jgi:hypothetical protein